MKNFIEPFCNDIPDDVYCMTVTALSLLDIMPERLSPLMIKNNLSSCSILKPNFILDIKNLHHQIRHYLIKIVGADNCNQIDSLVIHHIKQRYKLESTGYATLENPDVFEIKFIIIYRSLDGDYKCTLSMYMNTSLQCLGFQEISIPEKKQLSPLSTLLKTDNGHMPITPPTSPLTLLDLKKYMPFFPTIFRQHCRELAQRPRTLENTKEISDRLNSLRCRYSFDPTESDHKVMRSICKPEKVDALLISHIFDLIQDAIAKQRFDLL